MEPNILISGLSKRKCIQIPKLCAKKEKKASLKKVSLILQKCESQRTEDERVLLLTCVDEIAEIESRQARTKRIKDRCQEIEDPPELLRDKCKILIEAVSQANHLIVYTGAGISTSAHIPDYRGSQGIWTLLQKGKEIGNHDLSQAEPTLTHMALYELHKKGVVKYIVSQNCDGLHLRSGLPKAALSEVHGNMYIEVCRKCQPIRPYWRFFDTTELTGRYSHKTRRKCRHCGDALVDSIVHFGERGTLPWPLNWKGAVRHSEQADVILCLGSSLKVLKKYPWLWAMDRPAKKRPKIYIVNLQWTPKDESAMLKINGRCDEVISALMEGLKMKIPTYERQKDPLFAHATSLREEEEHTTTQPILTICKILNGNLKLEPKEIKSFNSESMKYHEQDLNCKVEHTEDIETGKYADKTQMIDCESKQKSAKSEDNVLQNQCIDHCQEKLEEKVQSYVKDEKCLQPSEIKVKVEPGEENNEANNFVLELKAHEEIEQNGQILLPKYEQKQSCYTVNGAEPIHTIIKEEDIKAEQNIHSTENKEIINYSSSNNPQDGKVESHFSFNSNSSNDKDLLLVIPCSRINIINSPTACDKIKSPNPSINLEKNVLSNDSSTNSKNIKNVELSSDSSNKFLGNEKLSQNLIIPKRSIIPPAKSSLFSIDSILSNNKPSNSEINANYSGMKSQDEENVCASLNTEVLPKRPKLTFTNTKIMEDHEFNRSLNHNSNLKFTRTFGSRNKYLNNFSIPHYREQNIFHNGFSQVSQQNKFFMNPMQSPYINTEKISTNFTFGYYEALMNYYETLSQNVPQLGHSKLVYSGLHSIIPINDQILPIENNFYHTNTSEKNVICNKPNNLNALNSTRKNKLIMIPKVLPTNKKEGKLKEDPQLYITYNEFDISQQNPKPPECDFCQKNYKSFICLFYKKEQDFFAVQVERKGKLIFCVCCDYSDSSDEEEEESKEEIKAKDETKPKSKVNDIANEVCSGDSDSLVENEIEEKVDDKSTRIQAGWFGKGYRKNRKKRRV